MISSFPAETELLDALDKHDRMIRDCVSGETPFGEFEVAYNSFYVSYPLDGHESDDTGKEILDAHSGRIAIHREIWEQILTKLCADDDASKEAYVAAGRFGSDEGLKRLRSIYSKYAGLRD